MGKSGIGSKNSKWKGGTHRSYKGYIRIGTRLNRNKYLHRYLIEELLRKPIACRYVFSFKLSEKQKGHDTDKCPFCGKHIPFQAYDYHVKKCREGKRVGVNSLIPPGMTIHHWDHRKQHNCYGNLQLLQKCIHDFCEKEYQRFIRENYDKWVEHWREEERWE